MCWQSASFSVTASNAGSYQWMQNGNDIATATALLIILQVFVKLVMKATTK
jgi:hypothetical protein